MSKTRIYEIAFIQSSPDMKSRLVRAGNVNQAIRHVADQIITGDVASQEALVVLLAAGVAVEDAREEVVAKDVIPTETQTSAAVITELPAHLDRRQKAAVG